MKSTEDSAGETQRDRDAELLERAAAGHRESLVAFYEGHVDALYAFVYYRVGRDAPLAEEAVQETFTLALARIGDYDRERGAVGSWLCQLSRNVIRSLLRAHRRSDELVSRWERIDRSLAQVFDALDREPLPGELIDRAETRELVNVTIANMPERYRQVLCSKYIDGDSLVDIAKRLELTEAAAKSLLARARRAFRSALSTLSTEFAEVQS